MIHRLPESRLSYVQNWSHLFKSSRPKTEFNIQIHGIGLTLLITNQKLLDSLYAYFPKAWIRDEKQNIVVDWTSPEIMDDSLVWDNIENPNCFFWEDYIWQRDFLVKVNNKQDYQLICHEKIDDGFYNFLRFLLPEKLLEINKFLFHSSCVIVEDQKPALFFGPSGAGKTTIASLFDKNNILGDDMNLMTVTKDKVFIEAATVGQRFFDKSQVGIQYPLTSLFWLIKSTKNEKKVITDQKMQYLLSSVSGLFWQNLNSDQMSQVFKLLKLISENSKLYELFFTRNHEARRYVESCL